MRFKVAISFTWATLIFMSSACLPLVAAEVQSFATGLWVAQGKPISAQRRSAENPESSQVDPVSTGWWWVGRGCSWLSKRFGVSPPLCSALKTSVKQLRKRSDIFIYWFSSVGSSLFSCPILLPLQLPLPNQVTLRFTKYLFDPEF